MEGSREYAAWVLSPPLPEHPTAPSSSYFVCGTPRSGSWLLCGLLSSTGVAGRPHEWFYRDTEETNSRRWGVAGFPEYVERVRDAGTTPNGVFGSKLMRRQLVDLVGRLTELGGDGPDTTLLERYFPGPRFIWVRREDTAAQAVSWSRAIQTGHWHHWDPGNPAAAPVYDRHQITALAREAVEDNAAWEAWFAVNGVDPLVVWFETLATDPVPVTREALAFLGVRAAGVAIRPQTVRSADHVNAEWLSRYRAPSDQPNRSSSRG